MQRANALGGGNGNKHRDLACAPPCAGARRLRRAPRGRPDRPNGHDRTFEDRHSRLHGRAGAAPCARRRNRDLDLRRRLYHDRQSALDGRPQLQPLGEAGALRRPGRDDQRPREPGELCSCPTDGRCRPAGNARSPFRPAPGGASCFRRRRGREERHVARRAASRSDAKLAGAAAGRSPARRWRRSSASRCARSIATSPRCRRRGPRSRARPALATC